MVDRLKRIDSDFLTGQILEGLYGGIFLHQYADGLPVSAIDKRTRRDEGKIKTLHVSLRQRNYSSPT